jgi:hypothetical protein
MILEIVLGALIVVGVVVVVAIERFRPRWRLVMAGWLVRQVGRLHGGKAGDSSPSR